MPGTPIGRWGFRPMRNALASMEEEVRLLERGESEGELDLCRELLEQLKLCSEHRLLFTLGY